MFNVATKDILFLAQAGISFSFALASTLKDDLRRNEEDRAKNRPDREVFRMISVNAY